MPHKISFRCCDFCRRRSTLARLDSLLLYSNRVLVYSCILLHSAYSIVGPKHTHRNTHTQTCTYVCIVYCCSYIHSFMKVWPCWGPVLLCLSLYGLIPPPKSLSDIFMVSVRELKYLLRLNAGAHTHTHICKYY